MSLINQMLRDLEARRAGDQERQSLQREVRALPAAARRGGARWLALLLGVGIAGGGAGWYAFSRDDGAVIPVVAPVAPPPPLPAAAPMLPPLPATAMLPREVDETTGSNGLRLTVALSSLPKEAEPAPLLPPASPAKPLPVSTPPVAAVAAEPALAATRLPPPPKAAERAAPAGQIEKTVSATSPRERAEADYRRGLAFAAGSQSAEAIGAWQGALRQDGGHAAARQALAKLLLDGHRSDEAAAVLRDGLEFQPAQIGWAMTLARLQVEQGDYPAAARTLAHSQPHAGRSADYQGFYGHVQQRLGQHRDALARYQAAVQLAPAEGRWWLGLGLALEAAGQAPDAREAFRRALATGNLGPELAAIAEQRGR